MNKYLASKCSFHFTREQPVMAKLLIIFPWVTVSGARSIFLRDAKKYFQTLKNII